MLIEDYRPTTFDGFVGHEDTKEMLQTLLEKDGTIPHLLFYGPAGTGKTTMALILAKAMFGKSWRGNFLEMNASEERGIQVIRGKVQDFCRTVGLAQGKPKVVFLDESDSLTKDAQNALRRIMEVNFKNCRFILSANYEQKLIEPLVSRCVECHFDYIPIKLVAKHIFRLMKKAGKPKKEVAIKAAKLSGGDMRKAMTILERYLNGGKISKLQFDEDVLTMGIKKFIDLTFKNSGETHIILDRIWHEAVKTEQRAEILPFIAETEFYMAQGTTKVLQLQGLFCKIQRILKGNN